MKKSSGRKQHRNLARKNRLALGKKRAAVIKWYEKRETQKRHKALKRCKTIKKNVA